MFIEKDNWQRLFGSKKKFNLCLVNVFIFKTSHFLHRYPNKQVKATGVTWLGLFSETVASYTLHTQKARTHVYSDAERECDLEEEKKKVVPISVGRDCRLFRSTLRLLRLTRLPIVTGSSSKKFSVSMSSWRLTHLPTFMFSTDNLFWSTFIIVRFVNSPRPSGSFSITFCERWRSVRDVRPPISSGRSSRRFSETSRQTRVDSWPISGGKCCNWLWSSQSSCSAGSLPMYGGCKFLRQNTVILLFSLWSCQIDVLENNKS